MPLPLAHGLLGASIIAAVHPKPTRRYLLPLLTGAFLANAADFDFLPAVLFHSKAWHRGFSHSIALAVFVCLGFVICMGRERIAQAVAYGLAFASHGILDYVTTKEGGGVELWWPFSSTRIGLGWVGLSELPSRLPALGILKTLVLEFLLFTPLLVLMICSRKFRADRNNMRKLTILILLILVSGFPALAQRTAPPSKAELAQITERGRRLAEYDVAAWYSSDAVMAMKPAAGSFARYIARKNGGAWTVAFGRLNEKRDKFLITYEATQGANAKEFTAKKLEAPKEDTGFFHAAAKAIDLSLADFQGAARPYNVAVLPAESNQLYVYVVPAQTKHGVFPLGGDARYLVSADGSKIIEKRQLHNAIIEFTPPPDGNTVTAYHTAVLDDIPEDTDVFHVLSRQPSVPELVATRQYVFLIKPDGTVEYLMTMEAFRKIK